MYGDWSPNTCYTGTKSLSYFLKWGENSNVTKRYNIKANVTFILI